MKSPIMEYRLINTMSDAALDWVLADLMGKNPQYVSEDKPGHQLVMVRGKFCHESYRPTREARETLRLMHEYRIGIEVDDLRDPVVYTAEVAKHSYPCTSGAGGNIPRAVVRAIIRCLVVQKSGEETDRFAIPQELA